jgi:hypothetical protein
MSSPRPSNSEIRAKVEEALVAIENGDFQVGPVYHLSRDFAECFIYDEAGLWELLPKLLREIQTADPVLCYAGQSPPDLAVEPTLDGLELWAYHWNSDALNFRAYLKFCIQHDRNGKPHYLHARIHPDRPFGDDY